MKYAVIVTEDSGETRVFVSLGGGWLDVESAKVWAEDYASSHDVDYTIVALEYPA